MGDNPGIIITEQMIDAQRRLTDTLVMQPLDLYEVRAAAKALRDAQARAGWSEAESKADAMTIIGSALDATGTQLELGRANPLTLQITGAVAEGFGIEFEFEAPSDRTKTVH